MVTERGRHRTISPLSAAILVVLTVASVLAGAPREASAQTAGLEYITSGSGDVDITQVVMNHGGTTVTQTSPATGVLDASNTELLIESVTINDNGVVKVLDEFNFTGIEVRNQNWSTTQTGVRTSENGVHTTPASNDFWDRVEFVLGSTDLRDYLDVHNDNDVPKLDSFEPDFDFHFQFPLDNDDYVLITERWGNTFFDLEPIDASGNVIAGSKRLGFDDPYGWNTGYAPSDVSSQPQWFTVVDVAAFEVDTDQTPIAGFRINNDGGADVKFFALSDESFTPQCPTGFYQVLSGRLNLLDPTTGTYQALDDSTVAAYNAMGFYEPEGQFYAISSNANDQSRKNGDLIRINPSNGAITNTGLNVLPSAYTADIDPATGLMHVSRGGNQWKVVDLDTLTIVDTLTFTSGDGEGRPGLADIAIIEGRAYGMTGDRLGVYDLDTLQYFTHDVAGVTGVSGLTGGWGSTYVVDGDQFYASNNNNGAIIYVNDVDSNAPRGTRISTGSPTGNNDGGSCPNAPDPFGSVDANDDVADVYPGSQSPVPVMANDTAPAGSLPRIISSDVEGTLEVRDDGVVLYTPLIGELSQTRTFDYELCPGDFESGHVRCDTATATLNVVCAPGLPIEDRPAQRTGEWSQLDSSTWRTQIDDSTVSVTLTGSISANESPMDSMDVGDYSQSGVAGNPALEVLHDFSGDAQLIISFSPPVVNPELHLARLGGYSGWEPLVYSHSSQITLGDDRTWTKTAGNGPHFVATSDTIVRTTGTLLDSNKTFAVGDYDSGTAAGSLQLDGVVDRIVLDLTSAGQAFGDTSDSIELLVTEPPAQGCGGLTTVQASKRSSSETVAVGSDVEWSLGTVSTGTASAVDLTVTDVLPLGLEARSLRSGSWLPTSLQAAMEMRQDGNWITIATVDGDDDVTYNLPADVDAVRMRFQGDAGDDFRTGVGARLVTRVVDPPMTGDEPDDIVNCAVWAANDMGDSEACDLIDVELNTSRPDLTVSNATGSAPPGGQISFDIRIENDPSSSRPYREPFVAVLLPAELDFHAWQPMSPDEPPTFVLEENHEGTGRTLVRWDFRGGARDLTAGEIFDIVLTTSVRAATPASSYDLSVVTSTNNTQFEVDCIDAVVADVNDVDRDGQLAEPVCTALTSFDVDVLFDVEVTASTTGRDDRGFLIYDDVEGVGAAVDIESLVTGENTYLESLPDMVSGSVWTTSTSRTSARSTVSLNGCGLALPSTSTVMTGDDCGTSGTRWFQRSIVLGTEDWPDRLVLRGDLATAGTARVYVNGVEQGHPVTDAGEVQLTGPWSLGVNLVEIEIDSPDGPARVATDLGWFRIADGDDGGRFQVNLATAGIATQDSTASIWNTADGPPVASRAIDGDTDGNYWNGSVTHSASAGQNWWHLDLGTAAPIDTIEIWNRAEGLEGRMSGARLFISAQPISGRTGDAAASSVGVIELPLPADLDVETIIAGANGTSARYLLITKENGQHLHIAEVKVLTHIAPAVGASQLDADWTVSDTLDGEQRPAPSVARSCVPNWGAAPGQGTYLWGENCERPYYDRPDVALALPQLDTGVNSNGITLADGNIDPVWDVTRAAVTTDATVVPNCGASAWSSIPAGLIWTDDCNDPGVVDFTAQFDLPDGTGHDSLQLNATTWIDNHIDSITINGVDQNVTDAGFNGNRPTHALTGPFNVGSNTIVIETRNTGGPGALSIDFEWVGDIIGQPPRTSIVGTQSNPIVDISQAQDVPSGVYWFDLDGVAPFQAEVDNSNGGGWVLVLNYVHQGGTNPGLDVRTADLPISTNSGLGSDESGSAAWGHAGNDLFAALDANEVRFYAETSAHDRIIDFRTFEGIDYFETGTGGIDLDGLTTRFTALDGHTAALPGSATNTWTDQGDEALTSFPFYHSGTEHWGVSGRDDRWEVDDFPDNAAASTIHRVWVRSNDSWGGTSEDTAENTTYYFHRDFELGAADLPTSLEATARFLVDNSVSEIYVNGVAQGVGGSNWSNAVEVPLVGPFRIGTNTITMAVVNGGGPAAFTAAIDFQRAEFSCEDRNGHTTRPCVAQTTSHGAAGLQIELENKGNVATGGIVAYQVLPYFGDVSPLTGEAVESDLRAYITGAAILDERPGNVSVTIAYSQSTNPCRPELFGGAAGSVGPAGCDNDWGAAPDDLSDVRAIRVIATPDAGTYWNAGDDLRVRFPMQVGQGSWERAEMALFPVAYVLDDAAGVAMSAVETSHAGVQVDQSNNGLGEWVWLDLNRNGLQDPGEEGMNGVEMELYDADRNLVATTVSQNLNNDSSRPGHYWFGDLEPGQYFIKLVEVPLSWNTMTPDIGFDDVDSDINPLTLEGPLVTVELNGVRLDQDLGFFVPQGPTACEDDREPIDPTDIDADRRSVNDASQCPT